MNVSEEQLAAIDEELSALGKDDEAIAVILQRFAEGERLSLDAVDGLLDELEAALGDAESILAAARANVPSTLVAVVTPEVGDIGDVGDLGDAGAEDGAEDDAALEMFSEPAPSSDDEPALFEDDEPEAARDAAEGTLEAQADDQAEEARAEASYTELEAQFFDEGDSPQSASRPPPADPEAAFFGEEGRIEAEPPLSEADLFASASGEDEEEDDGPADLSDLFDSDALAAAAGAEPIADITSAPSAADLQHDLFDDDEPESTHIFTVDDVAAIERRSKVPASTETSEAERAADAQIDAILAASDEELAHEGDRGLDVLFEDAAAEGDLLHGDLTRSDRPPLDPADAEEAEAAVFEREEDEFEMMIDDDDLLEISDDDLVGEGDATMVVASPLGSEPPAPAEAERESKRPEAEAAEEKKGGFFKKLFGGD